MRNVLEYRRHVSKVNSPCPCGAVLFFEAAKACRLVAHQLGNLALLFPSRRSFCYLFAPIEVFRFRTELGPIVDPVLYGEHVVDKVGCCYVATVAKLVQILVG